jgi:hypothetical protein
MLLSNISPSDRRPITNKYINFRDDNAIAFLAVAQMKLPKNVIIQTPYVNQPHNKCVLNAH